MRGRYQPPDDRLTAVSDGDIVPHRAGPVNARGGTSVAGWSMARARTTMFAAASALAIVGMTGCSSDDSSSQGTADRSSPAPPASVTATAAPDASPPPTTDTTSSLTAPTHPVGTST